ncbi:MAG: tetratricopeptide repeat protein [Anaerolineales bacterium]|nr:tetratricopeptide repeat protein [Anaerolineales bacterium]
MPLKLTLFGAPFAAIHTTPLHFRTDKIRALLIYLALENERPHERHALAALLWPDMPEQTALKNLRQSLHRLQQTLDEAHPGLSASLFQITRQTIRYAPTALEVDVLTFQGLLDACEAHPHRHLHLCQDCLTRLADAVALYRAEFLAGFGLSDAFAFEEWMFFWRERLQQQMISALGQLAHALAERGDVDAALPYATRLAALDPFREEAHRLLMRLFAQSGHSGKALAQYETCRRILQQELGVDPAVETTVLYRQLQAEQRGERLPATIPTPAVLHHFPVQFTPFVGRERELHQIEAWFLDPDSRLLTLVGPGGVGKTRLAIHAGEHLATKGGLADGIYFFSLAAIRTPEALLTTLLNGLGAVTSARHTPQASLLNHLRDRQCLLVLDNFEQLSDSAPLLGEMLATAPGLRLLVSSQLLLNLRAERRLSVSGLDYPAEGELGPNPMTFSAVRLFVESARQVDASFRISPENEAAVLRICQLVEGLPLALELAAAWVRLMSPQTIVREIGRSLDFLSLSPQDHPERHQSMGAVFAYAWQLLPSAEQKVLAQLAVFRGPFHLEAALDITEATPLILARLLDRSLLQRRKDGLYELHELLRQFVRQQTPPTQETARRHCDYYLNLLVVQEKAFHGPHPRQAVATIQRVLSNVRQAWQWAIEQQDGPAVERSFEGLGRFYQTAALLQEGEAMFAQANAQFVANPGLLVWQAYFLHKLGRHEALRDARQALACAGEAGRTRAEIYSLLGELLPREGQLEQAKAFQTQAIEYFQATSDLERLARALRRMALTCWRGGDHDEAMRYFQRAIPIHEAIQEKRGLAQLFNVLAGIYYERNELTQALGYVQKAQELYEAVEDKLDAAVVAANLARLYTHLGQFEKALASNQRAIDISQELGDRSGVARDLSNRGYILSVVGELDQSLDFYFRALDIARARNDPEHIAEFQAGLAAAHALKGDDETALGYYDLALPVLQAQGVPYHLVGPLLGKAELLYRRGDWIKAKSLVDEAKTLAQDVELAEFLHQSRILAIKLDYAEGNTREGLEQWRRLLSETEDETAQAALHYELWVLTHEQASAEAALAGYENVCLRVPSLINRRRLERLREFLA